LAHALPESALPAPDGKWSDLRIRFLSAAILGPVALLALWYGGFIWAVFIGLAMAGLGREWTRLAGLGDNLTIPFLLAVIWLVTIYVGILPGFAALALCTIAVAVKFNAFAAAGLPYAGLGGLSLLWLRLHAANGLADTTFLVAVIWGTDIGAYVVGRVIGGKKLAPKISPGKTWSGSLGGLLFGALAGATLAGAMHAHLPVAAAAALAVSLFAQGGDLLESAIKRKLGVKDSGDTIPGHGGLFDRLDGFLAASPLAALFALIAQGGLPLWR
jgi:phosphatidate cytidylyltransferase